MAQREAGIKRAIVSGLRWHKWLVKNLWQGPMSERGISDLVCLKDGRTVWLEVKVPAMRSMKTGKMMRAGKQSKDQIQFDADVKAHGGEYYVVRGVEDLVDIGMIPESAVKHGRKAK
jgi:hypothetical protein